MNESTKWLYEKLSSHGYNVGASAEIFDSLMVNNPESRKWAYNTAQKHGYNVGEYDMFERLVGAMTDGVETTESGSVVVSPAEAKENADSINQFLENRDTLYTGLQDYDTGIVSGTEQRRRDDAAAEAEAQAEAMRQRLQEEGTIERMKESKKEVRREKLRAFGSMLGSTPQVTSFGVSTNVFDSTDEQLADVGQALDAGTEYRQNKLLQEKLDVALDMARAGENQDGLRGVENLGLGLWDSATRLSTWDFGASDIVNNLTLQQIVEKWENDPSSLTATEKKVLDGIGMATAVQELYSDQVGIGYNVGQSLPESAGFMASMALNPASGLGKSLARNAVRTYGRNSIAKNLARIGGDIAETAIMTATTGAGRVAADALERINGSSTYEIGENGVIMYGGQKDQETVGNAVIKAIGSNFIENYSEALGEYFDPLLGMSRKVAAGGLRKMNLNKWADALSDVQPSQMTASIRSLREKTKFGGIFGEIMEEEIGMALNAISGVGDYTFSKEKADKEGKQWIFDLENQLTTVLSCAIMSGTLNGVEQVSSVVARRRMEKNAKNAEQSAANAFGEQFSELRESIDQASPEGMVDVLRDVYMDQGYSLEQKRKLAEYAAARLQMQYYNAADAKARREVSKTQQGVLDAYEAGRHAQLPTYYSIEQEYRNSEEAINASENAENIWAAIETLNRVPLEEHDMIINDFTEEEQQLIRQYRYNAARVLGAVNSRAEQAEDLIDEYRGQITPFTKPDGTVTTAILGDNVVFVMEQNENGDAVVHTNDGRKIFTKTRDLEYVQTHNVEELIERFRQSTEEAVGMETEKSFDHHPKTQAPQVGLQLQSPEGEVVITAVNDNMVEIVPAVYKDGQVQPKEGAEPKTITVDDAYMWQDSYYQGLDDAAAATASQPTVDNMSAETTENESTPSEEIEQSVSEEVTDGQIAETQPTETEGVAPVAPAAPQTARERVPKDKKGNPIYEQTDADTAWDAIVEETEGDTEMAQRVAADMLEDKKASLAKLQNGKPKKGATVAEKIANEKAHAAAIAQAQNDVTQWEAIVDTEARRREAAMSEADRYAAEMEQKSINEGLAALGEPQSLEEYVLGQLAGGAYKLRWSDKENGTKGFGSHTGLSTEEMKARLSMIDNKDGLTPEEVAHSIVENMDASFGEVDVMDVTNMVIDAVSTHASRRSMLNGMVESRAELLRQQEIAEQEAKDAWYMEQYHATEDELAAYNEYLAEFAEEIYGEDTDYEQRIATFAEIQLEYDNQGTDAGLRSSADQGEGLASDREGSSSVGETEQLDRRELREDAEGVAEAEDGRAGSSVSTQSDDRQSRIDRAVADYYENVDDSPEAIAAAERDQQRYEADMAEDAAETIETLENGDVRRTNRNSRGEIATVAIERDSKVVSVDSYEDGALFERTDYDDNGNATKVTRYKDGEVVSEQEYKDGKRKVTANVFEMAEEAQKNRRQEGLKAKAEAARDKLAELGFTNGVALPKGYKWSDGKKYGSKGGTVTVLVVGDDLYLRDNQKTGGFIPPFNINDKNHQNAVIKNFRQWPSYADFMTALYDAGWQGGRVFEDAIINTFNEEGMGISQRPLLRPFGSNKLNTKYYGQEDSDVLVGDNSEGRAGRLGGLKAGNAGVRQEGRESTSNDNKRNRGGSESSKTSAQEGTVATSSDNGRVVDESAIEDTPIKELRNRIRNLQALIIGIDNTERIRGIDEEIANKRERYKAELTYAKEVLAKKEGNKWGVEDMQPVSLETAEAMFNEWNDDADVKALFDRVFDVFKKFGIDIKFDDAYEHDNKKAFFDAADNHIVLPMHMTYEEYVPQQEKATILLHEMIHGVTQYVLHAVEMTPESRREKGINISKGMLEAANQLHSIYNHISVGGVYKDVNGMQDVHEMVSQLADPNFRAFLKEQSLWDKIVEAIQKLLGIPVENNALDTSAKLLDYILDNYDIEAYNKLAGRINRAYYSQSSDDNLRFREKEEPKELIAVHNISEDNLRKVLEAGNLIMPSIAITKADMGHTGFGEISLLFDKSTINPSDRRNKVYGGDAWTPRFPRIGVKLNEKVVSRINKKAYELIDDRRLREIFSLSSEVYPDNIEKVISDYGVEGYYNKEWMKLVYLLDRGKKIKVPMKMVDYGNMSEVIMEMAKDMGLTVAEIQENSIEFYDNNPDFVAALKIAEDHEFIDSIPEEKREAAIKLLSSKELTFAHFDSLISKAFRMEYDLKHGGLKQIVDKRALSELIEKRVKTSNNDYNKWVDELFDGIVEKRGIRNNRDWYTPSGNSRSWEQLYDPATPANILKYMLAQNEQGGSGGFWDSNIMGASAESYDSIEEIREKGKQRLKRLSYEEYDTWSDGVAERMSEICNDFLNPAYRNRFDAAIDSKIAITNAVAKDKTAKGIYKHMKREYPNFTMEHAKQVEEIVKEIQEFATGYFEAKPQRLVSVNEVMAAVVPSNANKEIVDALKSNGIEVVTYKKGDEEARKRVVKRVSSSMDIRFRDGKEKSPEIWLLEDESSFKGTAISSDYGAKILNNLDNAITKYENRHRIDTFIGDVAGALGIEAKDKSSKYATFEAMNGDIVTIRISDHNATVSNFDNNGEENGVSIVVSRRPNEGITNDGDAHIVEFFYSDKKLKSSEGKPLVEILKSIKQALYSGEYKDNTGLAEREEVNERLREGMGAISDREVSYENDPIAKFMGKPRYYGKRAAAFAERERRRMENAAKEAAEMLGIEAEIVTDASTLQGRKAKAKGWYDIVNKKVVVVVPNHVSMGDAVRTVLHEGIAHHGLRELFGDGFDAMLDNVYNNVSPELKARIDAIAERTGVSTSVATEEYMASLAETTNFEEAQRRGWWQQIKSYFVDMLRKLSMPGLKLEEEITDNELRYLLWRSYKNLVEPNSYLRPLGYAEDVVKQKELKVGEYAEKAPATPMAAEMSEDEESEAEEWAAITMQRIEELEAQAAQLENEIAEMEADRDADDASRYEMWEQQLEPLRKQMEDVYAELEGLYSLEAEAEKMSMASEDAIRYRLVDDPAEIERLESEPTRTAYRAMQVINGELYPPMSAVVDGKLREPIALGQWEQSEERPDLADDNGRFKLDKGNKKSLKAAYNPYFHSSPIPLNDQFSEAQSRDNLVIAEVEIPVSEADGTSGYKAEKAKDAVGTHEWKAGIIQSQFTGTRSVFLTRWDKPVRIVPDSEVADVIVEMFDGKDIVMPSNVVTPQLRAELEARGVPFVETDNQGKLVEGEHKGEHYSKVYGKKADSGLRYRMSENSEEFEATQKRAVDEVGIVADGLNEAVVEIVNVPRHDFVGTGNQAIEKARKWAIENISKEHTYHEGLSDEFRYLIDEDAVDKYLSKSSTHESDNLGIHLAVLKELPRVIDYSIEAEVHPDYKKKNKVRSSENGVGNNGLLVHRLYGAVNIDGKIYRAKTTIHEFKDKYNRAYNYKITEVEIAISGSDQNGTTTSNALTTPTSISGAKLLKGVEKSYDKGKLLLDESKKVSKDSRNSEAIVSEVERESAALGVPVRIARSVDELPDDADTRKRAEDGKLKGYYDPRTNEVVLYAPNTDDANDAKRTILHEIVGHKGLRSLIGEQRYDKAMLQLMYMLPADVRDAVLRRAERHGWNAAVAMDEYLAEQAERDVQPTWWGKVNAKIRALLRNMGFNVMLTDADVTYLLWRSRKNLQGDTAYDMATDAILKQAARKSAEAEAWNEQAFKDMEMRDFERNALPSVRHRMGADVNDYEKAVRTLGFKQAEAWQDSMRSLLVFQQALAKASGKDISDFENAYMYENRMSSANLMEMEQYRHMVYNPLLKEIHELEQMGASREDIINYLFAKSGLERNEVFARRDAKKHAEGDATKEQQLYDKYRQKDYAGLTALTRGDAQIAALVDDHSKKKTEYERLEQNKKRGVAVSDADLKAAKKEMDDARKAMIAAIEAEAQRMVDEFEAQHNTDNLWDKIRNCTHTTLNISHDAGVMSDEVYNELWNQFQYYIPLRGFADTTAEDVYLYLGGSDSPYNAPIKTAYGRTSLADDPIATIGNMAESAIVEANRNRLKQRFLYMVERHNTDLASISDVWLEYDDVNDEWHTVFAQIPDDATPSEAKRLQQEFEDRMKQLSEQNPGKYANASQQPNIPYRVVKKGDRQEHHVIVKRNGKDVVITINGNPRVAQAINGLTNPEQNNGPVQRIVNWVNRNLSANFTMRNPAFMVSNFVRDGFYTNSMVWVKENPAYARQYNKNWAICTAQIASLVSRYKRYEKGDTSALDMNNDMDRMFYEFMINGGETGYTVIKSVEDYKGLISGEMKKMEAGAMGTARRVADTIGSAVDTFGRWAEDTSRFAAYMTSRQLGRTVTKSIWDAKEISVNFNKKGSGNRMMGKFERGNRWNYLLGNMSQLGRNLYVFWNAGMQGLNNFSKAAKKSPAKFTAMAGTYFTLGVIIAAAFSGDDDEDDYYNLPEYVRRNNICFKIGKGKYATLPLPIEIRAIYGLGELAYSYLSGREGLTHGEAVTKTIQQITQVMPIDMMADGGGAMALVPSAAKPVVEVIHNVDWTGRPIYKEKTPWNQNDPTWTLAFKSTSPELVGMSRLVNEWTNKNTADGLERPYNRGWADNRYLNNPAVWEHILEGYLGGMATMFNQTKKTLMMPFNEDLREVRNVPIASRFIKDAGKEGRSYAARNEYYDAKNIMDSWKNEMSKAKKEVLDESLTDEQRLKAAKLRSSLEQQYMEAAERWKVLDRQRRALEEAYKNDQSEDNRQALDDVMMQMATLVEAYRD